MNRNMKRSQLIGMGKAVKEYVKTKTDGMKASTGIREILNSKKEMSNLIMYCRERLADDLTYNGAEATKNKDARSIERSNAMDESSLMEALENSDSMDESMEESMDESMDESTYDPFNDSMHGAVYNAITR